MSPDARCARLPAIAVLLLLVAAAPVSAADGPPAFLPLDQIRPGQRAVGRTVFVGRTIEEFELTIVGVVPGGRAEGAMILARGQGDRIEHDGIAAGMSGSPVFVDGKLIGALAFGWPFSRDALCGIQPAAEMRAVMTTPDRAPGGAFDDGPALPSDVGPESARPVRAGLSRLRTPLAAGGFPERTLDGLGAWADGHGFELVRGGSGAAATTPGGGPARLDAASARAAFVPGAAMAVDLLRGDMNLSAIGTLTWREGDRVVAFGHPLFQAGDVAFPLSLAEVTTIVASDLSSFKYGTPAEQVGTITQDRRAAIAGSIGRVPRMLPMTVRIHDARAAAGAVEAYRFDLLRHRQLAPQLAAIATGGALADASGALSEATWRTKATITFPGRAPLVLEDTGSGSVNAAGGMLTTPLALLLGNPFAPASAESLALDLTVTPGLSGSTIEGLRVAEGVVRPGDAVRVFATVRDRRGAAREVEFALPVPEDQPDGRLIVACGGGIELDRQEGQRLPARHMATSFEDLVARLADRRRDDHLYAALYGNGLEPALDGVPLPDLPAFAQRMLSADRANRPTDPWGRLAALAERNRDLAVPVGGLLTLTIEVRRRPDGPARGADRTTPMLRAVERDEEDG